MPKAETAEETARQDKLDARMKRLEEPLIAALEAGVVLLNDIRKGRKAVAVMLMFDQDNPDNVVGYRLGVVNLAAPTDIGEG